MPSTRSTMTAHDHRTPGPPIAGAVAAVALGSYLLPGLAGALPALRAPLGIEDRTHTGTGYALTFDDGPHAQGTPAVLELLASAGVSATFFLVGEQVQRNPSLAREILAAGHGIGVHCQRHRNLLRLTPGQTRADIERAEAIIAEATGVTTTLYRPPYGVLNAAALRLARSRGWRTLLWSQWGRDWERRATAASIAALVTKGVEEGSVLLLHDADDYSSPDSWQRTVAALPHVLATL
ncbi:MAG TPA: polysaccharide deacetylase family protein, partial [Solirubrobacteraceae bacterium]